MGFMNFLFILGFIIGLIWVPEYGALCSEEVLYPHGFQFMLILMIIYSILAVRMFYLID
jgi:hypothetical protein